jgi:hypothetical protein
MQFECPNLSEARLTSRAGMFPWHRIALTHFFLPCYSNGARGWVLRPRSLALLAHPSIRTSDQIEMDGHAWTEEIMPKL